MMPAPKTKAPACMPAIGRPFIHDDGADRHQEGADGADERPRARINKVVIVMLGVGLGHSCRLRAPKRDR